MKYLAGIAEMILKVSKCFTFRFQVYETWFGRVIAPFTHEHKYTWIGLFHWPCGKFLCYEHYMRRNEVLNGIEKQYSVICMHTVWGKIIQHVDEFSKFYISRLHTITKYGPHINNSMKGLHI